MNMISYYTLAEKVGREQAISILGNKVTLVEVEERSAAYDLSGHTHATLMKQSKPFFLELKKRNCKSYEYDTDLLEYDKLQRMMEVDGHHYYFLIFNDGIARLYDLDKIRLNEVTLSIKKCPISTVENNGIKDKFIIELPTKRAKNYFF